MCPGSFVFKMDDPAKAFEKEAIGLLIYCDENGDLEDYDFEEIFSVSLDILNDEDMEAMAAFAVLAHNCKTIIYNLKNGRKCDINSLNSITEILKDLNLARTNFTKNTLNTLLDTLTQCTKITDQVIGSFYNGKFQ